MRQTQIFSGSSHPALLDGICHRLGQKPGLVELAKFSNGETSVQIRTSIRNQDVFIVQSGSKKINDNVIELLIMISACKGGSAKSITAVMPYFPYSRQSKKKSHRGAITARMIANLLHVAGVNHVITIDLHASQMQGFFKCPIDNLVAEPLLARWIKHNVSDWKEGVVVSKNPGGTKRVTSLADALKLNFGIVTTDRRRPHQSTEFSGNESFVFERLAHDNRSDEEDVPPEGDVPQELPAQVERAVPERHNESPRPSIQRRRTTSNAHRAKRHNTSSEMPSSPLAKSALPGNSPENSPSLDQLMRTNTAPSAPPSFENGQSEEFTDERARDVIHGRFVQGHIVDEDYPSPAFSARSSSTYNARYRSGGGHSSDVDDLQQDPMAASFLSTVSSLRPENNNADHALGGSLDAGASEEEEEEDLRNPDLETTITLVGNVKDRPVFIVDDIIDKAGSWIAAAETAVKRGGATRVYCMATHGLFGGDSLRQMQECDCIDQIVVTNSCAMEDQKPSEFNKLVLLDVAPLLSEAIRRNHHGESISQLFMHFTD